MDSAIIRRIRPISLSGASLRVAWAPPSEEPSAIAARVSVSCSVIVPFSGLLFDRPLSNRFSERLPLSFRFLRVAP